MRTLRRGLALRDPLIRATLVVEDSMQIWLAFAGKLDHLPSCGEIKKPAAWVCPGSYISAFLADNWHAKRVESIEGAPR